ncbi:hypothetical protein PRIPAC_86112 [Pristionchus pacificus]|uniref:Uncharacterized protein n=1 Tax=Pristionchus pacificus TaxID=54126 RepID=A0A2A6C9E6_PRIPA|nr:hypothetical protein PRIPAC_86112 [Pristionchus pacificus]|eukprot:PDM74835.1 hypothetical protein PRIPAC_43325 [Pristionchus pacificus]
MNFPLLSILLVVLLYFSVQGQGMISVKRSVRAVTPPNLLKQIWDDTMAALNPNMRRSSTKRPSTKKPSKG